MIKKNMDEVLKEHEDKPSIEKMPLESLRDYRLYNEEAAKINKKLKFCKYPYKQCPAELHPHQRVHFSRFDQPDNPLKVFISNDKIHFDTTLIPGRVYDLPEYVIHYLSEKGQAKWDWVDLPNGDRETKIVGKTYKFNLRPVYQEAY